MNNQLSIFNQNQGPSNQLTLYFNPNYSSGFDLCDTTESHIIYRPINYEDGLIYNRISQQGQQYQIQHIKFYNLINAKLQEDQNLNQGNQEEQNEEEKQSNKDDYFDQINKNQITSKLLKQIDEYPSETEIILRQKIDKLIFEFEQVHDNSVTFCLIYDDDQKLSEINNQIDRFKQIFSQNNRNINIVIVVNGKEKHKFHNNFEFQENINENKCNLCCSYEYRECIFLVIFEEQSQIKLLNWIYRGIFKHFQSQYFYVGLMSIYIDIVKFRFIDQMIKQSQYCGATGYYNLIHTQDTFEIFNLNNSFVGYMNFLNYQFQIDSIAQLKRFHNPFFSYYKWNECYKYLDSYIEKLEREFEQGNINLHLNSLLPSLMFESKKEFFSASSNLGEKYIQPIGSVQKFLDLSNKIKCIIECNDQAQSVHGSRYKFILFLRNLQTKIKLAEILFLYTFSPYQLFYLNTSSVYLQILLTVFWPFILFLLVLFFVLLVQQYSIGVCIVKKKKRSINLSLSNNILQIQLKSRIHTINNILENEIRSKPINIQINQKYYRFGYLIKEVEKELQKELERNRIQFIQIDQNSQELKSINQPNLIIESEQNKYSNQQFYFQYCAQVISEKKVDEIYSLLFKLTQIVSIYCSITVIINLIITYGSNFIIKDQNQQQYVTIFGIIIFICVFQLRNFQSNYQYRSMVMTVYIFFNMLITIVYSEMYHLLRIKIKPKDYRKQIKKLSQYFCFNILVLIIFYIVETSMHFDGYIFSIIIFYNLLIYLLDSLMVIIAKIKECFMNPVNMNMGNDESEIRTIYQNEGFLKNYKTIINEYLKHLTKKQENNIKPQENNSNNEQEKNEDSQLIIPSEIFVQELIQPNESYEFGNIQQRSFDSSYEFESQ